MPLQEKRAVRTNGSRKRRETTALDVTVRGTCMYEGKKMAWSGSHASPE
jgi:hypothetical protein